MPGFSLNYPEFEFDVIQSDNPGYVQVGENNRYLKLGNETYCPFGPNLPYPETLPELNPQTSEILGPSESYRPTVAPLQSYLDYENNIIKLAEDGATHFRMILTPSSLDIEFEEIGNYHGRMHIAHEIDRILDLCDSLEIKVQFNMLIHYVLNQNVYHIKHWDWAHHTAYGSSEFSDAHPQDIGYCYRENEYFNLTDPYKFLTDELAQKYYKERLRYIISRWGYSTEIEMFELMSEINQIGDSFDTLLVPLENGVYSNYEPQFEQSRIQQQQDVYLWHKEMASFIKDELGHDWHLISTSYGGNIGEYDDSFTEGNIDICSINSYNNHLDNISSPGEVIETFNLSYFHDLSNPNYIGNYEYLPSKVLSNENNGKPLIFSETGPSHVEACDNGHEFRNNMWMTICSGVAFSNDWDVWIRPEHWHYFNDIKQFFAGIDLDGENWQPGHKLKSNDDDWNSMLSNSELVEMVFLWNNEKTQAIGVIRNRTLNYKTLPLFPDVITSTDADTTDDKCSPQPVFSNENADIAIWPHTFGQTIEYNDPIGNGNNSNKIRIKKLNPGNYTIQYYELDFPNSYFYESYDNGPNINVKYPPLSPGRPIVAFKLFKTNSKAVEHVDSTTIRSDELIVEKEENKFYDLNQNEYQTYKVFPNPSKGEFNVVSNSAGTYSIFKIDGSVLIKNCKLIQGTNEVNIPGFDTGIYILRININGVVFIERIVVQ